MAAGEGPGSGPYQNTNTINRNLSRQDFLSSFMDENLLVMFDKLRFIKDQQVDCSSGMLHGKKTLSQTTEQIAEVVRVTNFKAGGL